MAQKEPTNVNQESSAKYDNRLFVKFSKKIESEDQVKALHPDIQSVRFPRQKRTRWCWAIFLTPKAANDALVKMKKIKQVLVKKPNKHTLEPSSNKTIVKKEKKSAVKLKKNLRELW